MNTSTAPEPLLELLDGTPIAHVASLLPDGSPHSVPVWIGTHEGRVVIMTGPESRKARNLRRDPRIAISLAPPEDPFFPVTVRGRVVEWLDGDAGWAVVDAIAQKYIHAPYDRAQARVVDVDHQTMGM